MTNVGYIYSLNCPITNVPKYIGQTINDLSIRFQQHNKELSRNKKCNWIKSLHRQNLKPKIELIDTVSNIELDFWEAHYISLYRSWGFDLKNMTTGGGNGHRKSNETIARMREIKKGTRPLPHVIEASRLSNIGRKQSAKTIAKRVAVLTGQKRPTGRPSWNKGLKATDEARAKLRTSHLGKKLSEEHKRKIGVSNTGRKHTPEARSKMSLIAKEKGFIPPRRTKKISNLTGNN